MTILDDLWYAVKQDEIDATPHEQDFADWTEVGAMDFDDGIYDPPHWSSPHYGEYLKGYNNAWAVANGRTIAR